MPALRPAAKLSGGRTAWRGNETYWPDIAFAVSDASKISFWGQGAQVTPRAALFGSPLLANAPTLCIIATRVAASDLSRETVAAAPRISSRTLQRWLEEEGTSFQQLRDDTRRELAKQYLRESGSSSLTRVAALLGFEDQSSLSRACKRWFGESPGQYRARFFLD